MPAAMILGRDPDTLFCVQATRDSAALPTETLSAPLPDAWSWPSEYTSGAVWTIRLRQLADCSQMMRKLQTHWPLCILAYEQSTRHKLCNGLLDFRLQVRAHAARNRVHRPELLQMQWAALAAWERRNIHERLAERREHRLVPTVAL